MQTAAAQSPASGSRVAQLTQIAAPLNSTRRPALPDLASFVAPFVNGDASALRGAYSEGLFALPVVQQPLSSAGYVSADGNTVTQFHLAAQFGTVGLIAHNYQSGQDFFQLLPGQNIQLIYGDGRTASYWVTHIYRYRATAPASVESDFVDLDTGETLSAEGLFRKVYMGSKHVTFQTCIAQEGNWSWGRLFVIAEPGPSQGQSSRPVVVHPPRRHPKKSDP